MARTEERRELWGGETDKAVANFPVSGEPIPAPVARWLGRIKAAAARVNAELGLLDSDKADRIAAAGDRRSQPASSTTSSPIDVFQTGSGTSSNMNANEVMATLAGEDVHANDDVNMGQSSNDSLPLGRPPRRAGRARQRPAAGPAAARRRAGDEGDGVRRRRQVGMDALDGCRARHPRPGVRRLHSAGATAPPASGRRSSASAQHPAGRHGGRHGPEHPPRVPDRVGQALGRLRAGDPPACRFFEVPRLPAMRLSRPRVRSRPLPSPDQDRQ